MGQFMNKEAILGEKNPRSRGTIMFGTVDVRPLSLEKDSEERDAVNTRKSTTF